MEIGITMVAVMLSGVMFLMFTVAAVAFFVHHKNQKKKDGQK
ncbi:hypothetical protein [Lederbergia citrea]|nr:hypothetical protein [Lederbergia citrea]